MTVTAGRKNPPGWNAHRVAAISAGEINGVGCQTIEIRCLNKIGTVTGQAIPAHLVGDYHNDIHLFPNIIKTFAEILELNPI